MDWPPVRCGWRHPAAEAAFWRAGMAGRDGVNLYGTVKVGGTEIGDYIRSVVYQVLSEMVQG